MKQMLGKLLNLFRREPPACELSGSDEQHAGCYFVNGRLLIHAISRTTAGVGLAENPVIVDESDNQQIGSAIMQALSSSRHDVPHTKTSVFQPFLKAAGVRSYKAFMKDATLVDIEKRGSLFIIQRWNNEGPKEGFKPSPEEPTKLTEPTIALLGASIRYALDLAGPGSILAAMGGTEPNLKLPPRRRSEIH